MTARDRLGRLLPENASSRDERGASLVFAMIFISSLALMLAAVTEFGYTGMRVADSTRSRRVAYYEVDGAIELAIASMRADVASGRYGSSCPGQTLSLTSGRVATVTCTPQPGSGSESTSPGAQLEYALIATEPVAGSPAVSVTSARARARVRGGVLAGGASASIQVATGATFDGSSGTVLSAGSCTGSVLGLSPSPTCSQPTAYGNEVATALAPFTATTPNFSGLPARTVPACPTSAPNYVALQPGRYTSAAALSSLTDGSCPRAIVHLQPGVFQFSFSGGGTWTINDSTVHVVAGEPDSWTPPAVGAARPNLAGLTVLCKTDADTVPNEGTLLAFDANARIDVRASAKSEFCGNGSIWLNQRVSIYQAPNAVISSPGSPLLNVGATTGATKFTVRGTVYALKSGVRQYLRENVVSVFERGVYVAWMDMPGYASSSRDRTFTPLTLAGCSSSYADRTVELVVTIDGTRRARALIGFVDGGGESPGTSVKVLNWRQS